MLIKSTTCYLICYLQTATACFFSVVISRINSLDRLVACWWMCNCFLVHSLRDEMSSCSFTNEPGWVNVLVWKDKRALRLNNLMPWKHHTKGWLPFCRLYFINPTKKERWMAPYLLGAKYVDLLKMRQNTFWTKVVYIILFRTFSPQKQRLALLSYFTLAAIKATGIELVAPQTMGRALRQSAFESVAQTLYNQPAFAF